MSTRRELVVSLALVLVACAPQIVDAVDAVSSGGMAAAGAANTGGRGGTTVYGGSGGSGAEVGSGASPGAATGGSSAAGGGTGASDGGSPGEAGATGCDALGSAGLDLATCEALVGSIVHRYTFDGAGTAVTDVWGGPSGKIVNSTLTGDGAVTLAGHMSDQYVDLPNGILSALDSATLEAWLTWMGGSEWQRIFDFGSVQTGVEDSQSSGASYLFLTPRLPDAGGALLRVAYQRGVGASEARVDATRTLPAGRLTQVAVTFDAATTTIAIYIDGSFENAKAFDPSDVSLRAIDDVNNWLGRSQYGADAELNATIEDFRIYSRALNMAELNASFEAGANPTFLARERP